jgi:xylulokinase
MKKAYMLGIDIGSGGCKVTIVDNSGEVAATAFKEYPTDYPHPGWAEQHPSTWYEALRQTLKEAVAKNRIDPKQIASIAVGAATHTLVLLGSNNEVLRPAILWRDKRTISQVEALRASHGKEIFDETLHMVNVNWTLPYLLWIREKEPEVWEKAKTILMPKDYIRLRLTGELATDWMDAHGTMLFNVPNRKWSQKVCDIAQIPMELLPPVFPPEKIIGTLSGSAAKELGLVQGTPVVMGTTDQAAEAFGAGAIESGQGIIKLATAGNVAIVTDSPHPNPPKVYAYYHILPSKWYTLAGTISCAVCYRWLRDALCEAEIAASRASGVNTFELMDRMAGGVPVGCEGLIYHPHLQGAIWDPYLKANFFGITSRHGKAHFVRTVLEGVAFSLYSCVREIEKLGVEIDDFRIIGGGAASPLWRQIVCDVVGKPLIRPQIDDSSFGTALVGGLGVGLFSNVAEAVRTCVHSTDSIQPSQENHAKYARLFEVYEKVSEDLSEASRSLHCALEENESSSLASAKTA